MKYIAALTIALTVSGAVIDCGADEVLPQTKRLDEKRPLDQVMVEGIRRFCLRETELARDRRGERWRRDYANPTVYETSIRANRERFRTIIGAADKRVTSARKHEFELLTTLNQSSVVARSAKVTVHAVRWPVLDGVTAEGLMLRPRQATAAVVAVPDADWDPESLCGLRPTPSRHSDFVRRLAEAGCIVVIPSLISRRDEYSGHPHVGYTNQPHREFLYRQSFVVGRHPIGFEVQKILAAVDLLQQMESHGLPVGVAGVGEGGLLALYAAALDPRIQSTVVSGYFGERQRLWREPIYRNVWRLLTEFGDAEIASLIAPRRLVIEACSAPEISSPPAVRQGRRTAAAPGRIVSPSLASVTSEFKRAAVHYERLQRSADCVLVPAAPDGTGAAGSFAAARAFGSALGLALPVERKLAPWQRTERKSSPHRERRQLAELQAFVQREITLCHQARRQRWQTDLSSIEHWERQRIQLQRMVHDEVIGRLNLKRSSPNPRTRLIIDEPAYRGYEVVLDVGPDIIAAGVLLLPRDLARGEKRPVVVCQHGLEGRPIDTISREPAAFRAYKSFAAELVQRGFVVYAPQNPYRGNDRFRSIQRMANPLGLTLFSFIVEQHRQTLAWLSSLPQVDDQRIAFYGLSYGGKTAMRVPPLLDAYCLSICSGDFTDWPHTIANNYERYSYAFTSEYEIPEWNMGRVANYAELAFLMSPRPFMVEAGHRDGGQPSELVASEFGKVRRHYDTLGISDRAKIEFFDGPHTINGQGSFAFLHERLKWPAPTRD